MPRGGQPACAPIPVPVPGAGAQSTYMIAGRRPVGLRLAEGAAPRRRHPPSGRRGTCAGRTEEPAAPPARPARRVHSARASPGAGPWCRPRPAMAGLTSIRARAALRGSSPVARPRRDLAPPLGRRGELSTPQLGCRPPRRVRGGGDAGEQRSGGPVALSRPPGDRAPALPAAAAASRPARSRSLRRWVRAGCRVWGPPATRSPSWRRTDLSLTRLPASSPAILLPPWRSLTFHWTFHRIFSFIPSFHSFLPGWPPGLAICGQLGRLLREP